MEVKKHRDKSLTHKVAIVTGASQPAGRAVARRFAMEGARVILVDTQRGAAKDVRDEIEQMGGTAHVVVADAATEQGAKQITHTAIRRYGRLNTIVHNVMLDPVEHLDVMEDGGFDLDLSSLFPMTLSGASAMMLQAEGSIVYSVFVREHEQTAPEMSARVRAGFGRFVHAAAASLYEHGITVNGIELDDLNGSQRTHRAENKAHLNFVNAYRKAHRFEDVAYAARFIASCESCGITGQVLTIGGGRPPSESRFVLSEEESLWLAETYRRTIDGMVHAGGLLDGSRK